MRFLIFGQCNGCVKLQKQLDFEQVEWQSAGGKMVEEIKVLKQKVGEEVKGGA